MSHEVIIPSREAMARDGIPPEVMQHFRRQAGILRAATFAAAFHRLRDLANFGHWRRSAPARARA